MCESRCFCDLFFSPQTVWCNLLGGKMGGKKTFSVFMRLALVPLSYPPRPHCRANWISRNLRFISELIGYNGVIFSKPLKLYTQKPKGAVNNRVCDCSPCVCASACLSFSLFCLFYAVILPKVTRIPRTSGSTCKYWRPTSEKPQIRILQLPTITWISLNTRSVSQEPNPHK